MSMFKIAWTLIVIGFISAVPVQLVAHVVCKKVPSNTIVLTAKLCGVLARRGFAELTAKSTAITRTHQCYDKLFSLNRGFVSILK